MELNPNTAGASAESTKAPSEPHEPKLRSNAPGGDIETRWDRHRFGMKLVNPANKRKYKVIVVGTGLAGASAAATLAELGYNVKTVCFQDSPRRGGPIHAKRPRGTNQLIAWFSAAVWRGQPAPHPPGVLALPNRATTHRSMVGERFEFVT
jgi:hypothetical protein